MAAGCCQGAPGKAAQLRAVSAAQGGGAIYGGITDDQPVDADFDRNLGDVFELMLVHVWTDLGEQRRLSRCAGECPVARLQDAHQKLLHLGARLQAAQARRVRGGEVDDQIVRKTAQAFDAGDVIARRICRIAILARICSDDAAHPGVAAVACEALGKRSETFAVEAETIDHGFIFVQAEQPGLRIALLGPRRHRPGLDEPEAKCESGLEHVRVLVEPRGEAHRIGKREIPGAHGQQRIFYP